MAHAWKRSFRDQQRETIGTPAAADVTAESAYAFVSNDAPVVLVSACSNVSAVTETLSASPDSGE